MSESVPTTVAEGRLARFARLSLFVPLRGRDYRLVWFGESVSLLGDQFHYVALSWLVLGLTGSGLALGTVLLAASLPRGAFVLVGGVLADRVSPRALMLGSNVIRAIVTTVIAGLVLGSQIQIWQLVMAGVVFGTVDAVFFPAINTIVARLAPTEHLASANALLQGTQQLMNTIGPAIAGITVAIIGVGAAFAIDAASFAVAATALWLVRTDTRLAVVPPADRPAAVAADRPSVRASLVEGARAVLGDPALRILVVLSTAFNVAFTGPIVVGLPWLVQVRFGGDASMLGLLLAAFGGGAVVGIVLAGSLARPSEPRLAGAGHRHGSGRRACGDRPGARQVDRRDLPVLIGAGVGYLNVSIISWAQARSRAAPARPDDELPDARLGRRLRRCRWPPPGSWSMPTRRRMFLAAGGLVVAVVHRGAGSGLPRRMTW